MAQRQNVPGDGDCCFWAIHKALETHLSGRNQLEYVFETIYDTPELEEMYNKGDGGGHALRAFVVWNLFYPDSPVAINHMRKFKRLAMMMKGIDPHTNERVPPEVPHEFAWMGPAVEAGGELNLDKLQELMLDNNAYWGDDTAIEVLQIALTIRIIPINRQGDPVEFTDSRMPYSYGTIFLDKKSYVHYQFYKQRDGLAFFEKEEAAIEFYRLVNRELLHNPSPRPLMREEEATITKTAYDLESLQIDI